MTPIEIIDKLEGYKSLSAQKRLLGSLAPDDNFWFEAHHGLSHFHPWPMRFVLDEQKHSGQVKYANIPNVLRMIIDGILDGSLGEKGLPRAVTALSLRARPDEWEKWFEPVLSKSLVLPVDVTTFNEYAPEHLKVPGMPVAPQIDIMGVSTMSPEFYVEPILEGEHLFWFLRRDGVTCYHADGTRWDTGLNYLFEQIVAQSGDDVDLVLEAYTEDEVITLADIHNATLFIERGHDPWHSTAMPMEKRYEAIRAISEMLEQTGVMTRHYVTPIEAHLCKLDDPTTTREAFNTFIQQGFPGVILRRDHGPQVVVRPTKKSVLTCTDITEGEGKLASGAEYVVGSGTMARKKFTSPVFSGLTFEARRTILQEKAKYVGQKFEVVSCGLGPDGKLVFPVFQKWRMNDE